MDSTAQNVNITVDDFDSLVAFDTVSDWSTPDPSSPSFIPKSTPWWMGTFHKTNIVNSAFKFNFTGPAIYVYGAAGPTYGSYQVELDGVASEHSAYATANSTTPYVLFSSDVLSYSNHSLTIRNLGSKDQSGNELLFDYLQTTVQVGPSGATVTNTTLEETDPSLNYSGVWGNNKSGNFSGGGSTYTNADGASVSLSFHGSAIYVFGDKKNDHGLYNVSIDDLPAQTFTGVSGCGGAFGMTCEQQQPTIKFFASNLDSRLHSLKITNIPGINNSFFDLDSIVLTVPSVYAPRTLSSSTASSTGTVSQTGTITSGSSTSTQNTQNNAAVGSPNVLLLFLIISILLLSKPHMR